MRTLWNLVIRRALRAGIVGALAAGLSAGVAGEGIPVEPATNTFAADEWRLPAAGPALTPGPNLALVNGQCALCHSLDYVSTQPPLTRAQWTANVDKMRLKFGSPLATNQVSAVVDYLTANYGVAPAAK